MKNVFITIAILASSMVVSQSARLMADAYYNRLYIDNSMEITSHITKKYRTKSIVWYKGCIEMRIENTYGTKEECLLQLEKNQVILDEKMKEIKSIIEGE